MPMSHPIPMPLPILALPTPPTVPAAPTAPTAPPPWSSEEAEEEEEARNGRATRATCIPSDTISPPKPTPIPASSVPHTFTGSWKALGARGSRDKSLRRLKRLGVGLVGLGLRWEVVLRAEGEKGVVGLARPMASVRADTGRIGWRSGDVNPPTPLTPPTPALVPVPAVQKLPLRTSSPSTLPSCPCPCPIPCSSSLKTESPVSSRRLGAAPPPTPAPPPASPPLPPLSMSDRE
ncbi:hypothetical protein B484DRAFT_449622 [Ochromonadaceae sp. CCMP2298]|nr:hypothetical protein B484DRAFT_449622 [Ochromonadaceae sp. CCMP2298]